MASNRGQRYCYTYPSAIGALSICSTDRDIVAIGFGPILFDAAIHKATSLTNDAINQIHGYLAGKRSVFSVPISYTGSDFQIAVWQAVQRIPYGQTRTYKDIAASIGHADAYRAVGSACNANPLPLLIPCHRVVGSNGLLGGYLGGNDIKRTLLQLEQKFS